MTSNTANKPPNPGSAANASNYVSLTFEDVLITPCILPRPAPIVLLPQEQ